MMTGKAHLQVPLSNLDYTRFHDLILARTGLVFADRRRDMLSRVLEKTLHHTTCSNLDQYFDWLQNMPTNSPGWDELIKGLTVCETYFFRDEDQIEILRRSILPNLIAHHQNDHTLRLWSAGCSTGEEAYTLAILLRQLITDIHRWQIFILATDINKHALMKAKQAHYREWSFRQTDKTFRNIYFTQHNNDFELLLKVRQMVTIAYLNLAENCYPSPENNTEDFDLILCRNVLIYLPETVIRSTVKRFYDSLLPGGWLVVGPSENNDPWYSPFEAVNIQNITVYQKEGKLGNRLLPSESVDPLITSGNWMPPLAKVDTPFSEALQSLDFNFDIFTSPPEKTEPAANSDVKETLLQQGKQYRKQNRYEDALCCLTEYVKICPEDMEGYYQLAHLEANTNHLKQARSWGELALQRDPLKSETYYILALLDQDQGEIDQAIQYLRKALYLDPNFILAHFSLANLYQKTGKLKEAARHHSQSIRLAAKIPAEQILPGSDDLTVANLLLMAKT